MITLSDLSELCGYDVAHVKDRLKRGFEDALGVESERGALTESESQLAEHLSVRHRSRDWIYRLDDKRRKRREHKRQRS